MTEREIVQWQSLRVDLRDVGDNPSYALYVAFQFIPRHPFYDLYLVTHNGTAGEYGVTVDLQYNTRQKFVTRNVCQLPES